MSKKNRPKKPLISSNTLLASAEQKIQSSLTPGAREDYLKIVVSGLRALLDKGENGLLAQMNGSKDPIADCARGAVNLVALLYKESRGTMPERAIPPAAMTLMLHGLDFAEKAKITVIDREALIKATRIFTNYLFQTMKISPSMLHHAAGKVHDIMKDPASAEAVRRKAGVVADPRASKPTEVVEEDPVDAV